MLKKSILYGFLTVFLVISVFLVNLIWFKPFFINHFFERVFVEFLFDDPELKSQLRIFESVGINGHNAKLSDASEERGTKLIEKTKRDLATLRSYNREKLDEQQQISYDVLELFLQQAVDGERFRYHNYPLNQLFGIQSGMPDFMINTHQINTAEDADFYVRRLNQFPRKFNQVLAGLKTREQNGIIPPRFVIEKVLLEMKNFVSASADSHVLATHFSKEIDKLSLESAKKSELLVRCTQSISDSVFPAYATFISFFEELLPKSTTDDGVWKLPDGDAYYAHALKNNITVDLTPAEVHEIGVKEVARIKSDMFRILDSLGYKGTSMAVLMNRLAKEERFLYPDSDEGRAACLADYQKMIDHIDQNLGNVFNKRPKMGVRVERIPEFKEKTSPGAYYNPPPFDGSKPGVFYANLRNMNEIPKYGMRTLAYHEAIPGHHFQIALQQEITGVPMFRKILPFTVYAEGWALYSELVAFEYGFHADPFDNLGRLQAELFRAVRLVVDTGIHFKRWPREQAIAYMLENTGMPEGDVVAEIERYIVMPGQACAYKIGMLKLVELREKTRNELGESFDIRTFHDWVLQSGSLPLPILEKRIQTAVKAHKSVKS